MTEIGPKSPRLRDEHFLAFVRKQPCCVCKAPAPSDPAHIRMASTVYGKRATGMAEKPDDRWATPLCRPIPGFVVGCHQVQHAMNEAEFWRMLGINPFEIAIRLYAEGGHPNETQPKRRKATIKSASKIPSRQFQKTKRKFGT